MLLTDEIIIWKKIERLNLLVLFFSSVELVKNYCVEVNILIDLSKEIWQKEFLHQVELFLIMKL